MSNRIKTCSNTLCLILQIPKPSPSPSMNKIVPGPKPKSKTDSYNLPTALWITKFTLHSGLPVEAAPSASQFGMNLVASTPNLPLVTMKTSTLAGGLGKEDTGLFGNQRPEELTPLQNPPSIKHFSENH